MVNLHGGEPTIDPRLFDLLETALGVGVPGGAGRRRNARRMKDPGFVARLIERNVRSFVISLHGSDAATQDQLTQTPGGFDETIVGIRNAKAAGRRVQINAVLTRTNMARLSELCQLCLDLGVDQANISNLHPVGSGYFALDQQAPSVRQTRQFLLPAVELVLAAGMAHHPSGVPAVRGRPGTKRLAIEDADNRSIRMMYQGVCLRQLRLLHGHRVPLLRAAVRRLPAAERLRRGLPRILRAPRLGRIRPHRHQPAHRASLTSTMRTGSQPCPTQS